MIFSSITFLFFFLPIALTTFLLAGRKGRNLLLLAVNFLFYIWGEQGFVLVLLASIVTNYILGLLLDKTLERRRKIFLAGAIAANIFLLAYFKYANFIIDNINKILLGTWLGEISIQKVHLPVGISFFTFKAISYLIDIYKKKYHAQRNPVHFGVYLSFFPQIAAGPIARYSDLSEQIKRCELTLKGFSIGVERFIFGLGKKVLIANQLSQIADQVFALPVEQLSTGTAWLGILCYSLQLYFDFSGYSDMALGLGGMFGFRTPENFDYPYISRSIREFWRRWHISLSTWFRDYVYIPLGGNRNGHLRTAINLMTVFLLCGLWHGASWNFVVWGLLHGFFLVLERGRFGRILEHVHPFWQHAYTLLAISSGWVLFRLEQLADVGLYLSAMCGATKAEQMLPQISMKLDSMMVCSLLAAVVLSMPVYPWLRRQWRSYSEENILLYSMGIPITLLLHAGILIASASRLAAGSYNPFVYFRF